MCSVSEVVMGEFDIKIDRKSLTECDNSATSYQVNENNIPINVFDSDSSDDTNVTGGLENETLSNTENREIAFIHEPKEPLVDNDPMNIKKRTAAMLPRINYAIGKIKHWWKGNTKDGSISATKQGLAGDCWLLSSINSLSYSEKGREIIRNALEYTDGGTIVHFKGVGDYFISDRLLYEAKGALKYSNGDDDMNIIELAVEAVLDDVANNRVMFSDERLFLLNSYADEDPTCRGVSPIDLGDMQRTMIYLLTGKISEFYDDTNAKMDILLKFEQNEGENMVVTAGIGGGYNLIDCNGKNHYTKLPHMFSVIEVSNGVVTLVDPENSEEEMQFDEETIISLITIEATDLSDDNPEEYCAIKLYKSEIIQADGSIVEEYKDKEGNIKRTITLDKKGNKLSRTDY